MYNPSKSSTATKLSGATWSISYGDGSSSSGNVYKDTVTIGGLTVTNQAVELAETVSSTFTEDSVTDGLVGLAFSSLNTVEPTAQKTFFDNAKSSLDSPVFTADLGYHARKSNPYLKGCFSAAQQSVVASSCTEALGLTV